MEFRILGPLEVWHADRRLELGPPKQRALIAKLLQHPNQVVSLNKLARAVWGEVAPETAPEILHTYIYRLRQVLRDHGRPGEEEVLCTRPPGYLLRLKQGELDLDRFESLAAEANSAAAAGEDETAAGLLRSALSLWRGEALGNVASEELRRGEAMRLEERRLAALEARIDADLRLGRHRELTGELATLIAEQPLREGLHAQLMLALYRSGRPADALASYRRLRQTLIDELGLEPSADLQRLQRAILLADPSLDPAKPRVPAPVSAAWTPSADASASGAAGDPLNVRPCQLPPDIAWFTGREQELAWLQRRLRPGALGTALALVAIDGPAGVGKSTLATRAAHRLAARFPDGQLYVDLQGAADGLAPLHPSEVLGRFLRAFGVGDRHLPDAPKERAGLLRSLLARRRVLVVLDNAASAAQVQLLLPAGAACAALVTSRRHLTELDGAAHICLDMLPADEAVALLVRLAGSQRVAAEPAAAGEVARYCGHLPLALRIAGARLAARPAWPLHVLAARLRDEHLRLDELELDGLAVRASLHVAYREIGDRGHDGVDAARALRLLALLDGGDAGGRAAAALLDQPQHATEAALERLVDANLLESRAPRRYRFHDLVRLFARERARRDDAEADRAAAVARALRYYLAAVRAADRLLRPGQLPVEGELPADRPGFRDCAEALDWLETERANLLAAIGQAAVGPDHQVAWQLAAALYGFFDLRGAWDEWEQANRMALEAAQRCNDRGGEAQVLRDLGAIAWRRFRLEEATGLLQRSMELRRLTGDRHGEAQTLNSLGLVLTARRHHQDAAACLERSLALFREAGDLRGAGQVRNNLGDLYRQQSRYEEALTCLQEDLAICRKLNDRRGEAITLSNLGELHRDQRQGGKAFDCHHESLVICRELGDVRGEGLNLDGLGEALRLQGRHQQAVDLLQQGAGLLRDVADHYGEADALWHLGLAMDAVGDGDAGTSCLRRALTLFERIGAPEADDVRDLMRVRGSPEHSAPAQ